MQLQVELSSTTLPPSEAADKITKLTGELNELKRQAAENTGSAYRTRIVEHKVTESPPGINNIVGIQKGS
jgi:hypothetical protein